MSNRRLITILVAILLGGIGAHKFFLGKIFQGLIYVLFCWTGIPAIIAIIEAIYYLIITDEEFDRMYPAT